MKISIRILTFCMKTFPPLSLFLPASAGGRLSPLLEDGGFLFWPELLNLTPEMLVSQASLLKPVKRIPIKAILKASTSSITIISLKPVPHRPTCGGCHKQRHGTLLPNRHGYGLCLPGAITPAAQCEVYEAPITANKIKANTLCSLKHLSLFPSLFPSLSPSLSLPHSLYVCVWAYSRIIALSE